MEVSVFFALLYIPWLQGVLSADIKNNLKYFEVIHAKSFGHNIVKRGIHPSDHPFNKIREVNFKALGRDFRLILSPKKGLLHPKFRAVEMDDNNIEKPIRIDHETFYDGRVYGETKSRATVHLEPEGMITAKIETPEETYHIEPSWRHITDSDPETMIAYKESDINFSWTQDDFEGFLPPKVCGYVKENATSNESKPEDLEETYHKAAEELELLSSDSAHSTAARQKRQAPEFLTILRQTRCPLLLVADYRFFNEMGGGSSKTTVNYLISLIDRVHKIYEDTVWSDKPDGQGFSGMGFIIKKIVVHRKPTEVRQNEQHYNMKRSSWDVRTLLEVFSREFTHKDFCLAHLFTDIKFEGGILGLAYVGSPRRNSVGGICTPEYFKNGYTLYLNSGLSSSRNHYGQRVITREADLVTAHEFGHNWGSEHDPDVPECSPSASHGGSYLMYTYSVSGYDVNNKKFSPCSLRFIRKVLVAKSGRCFTEPEESFCGNLRVEGDEECDAGLLGSEDSDECCDEYCKLKEHAKCSDKNSPCCSRCNYSKPGDVCRHANYATCEKEATCNGKEATCPASLPMADSTKCIDRGECRGGKCIPFCETQDLQTCMCDTTPDSCKRCCRMNLNTSCFVMQPEEMLPDGTPCKTGFCNKGVCEPTMTDIVVRIWGFFEDFNLNSVMRFLKDNLVGTVVVISLLIWIPASCLISWIDRQRADRDQKEWEWRRQDELIHPEDKRRIIHIRVPRRTVSLAAANQLS